MYGQWKITSAISLAVVLLAIYYRSNQQDLLQERVHKVLKALLKKERKNPIADNRKVAVGYGACKDIFADAHAVLNFTNKNVIAQYHQEFNTMTDVEETFAYFFTQGAACE